MLANHFRRFFVLFVVVGLVTAVLRMGTAVTAQQPVPPPAPDERTLLPHLPTEDTGEGVGQAIFYPPDWSKGVFQSYRDGNWEVYSSQPPYRLTNHGSSDMHPRYNRGATHIVFSSNRDGDYEIYVMNANGSGLQQLTHDGANDVNPVWSPDGSQIAFQSYRDGQAEVYVMDANGLNERRLTAHGSYDGEPTWSPDGSQLAFTSARTGTPYIYVMNSDGTGISQRSGQPSVYPAWSPDGSQIAYSGDQDGDGWLELWLMNADGSNQHMLYDPPFHVEEDAWARGWSPDGREITFTTIKFIQYQGNWYWEWANADYYDLTSNTIHHLDDSALNWHPDWQTTDVTPPQTKMETLGPYSQIPDFQVRWSGADAQSGAGLSTYDVQYKVGSSGQWMDWHMGVTETSAAYTAVPGTTVSFRARARDNAFNVEAWPTVNKPTTTFYTWALEGKLTDNRGAPLAQAPLMVNPLPLNEAITDGNGDFFSRLKTAGAHTLDVNRSGYGDLAPTSLNMENLAHIYLPPANNALLNGGFEAATPLDNWTTTGTVTAVTNPRHTGTKSALLGSATCPFPCLSVGEMLTIPAGNTADMVADSQGYIHIIAPSSSSFALELLSRSPSGIWAEPQTVSAQGGALPQLTIDQEDTLHALWTDIDRLYYARKSTDSNSWSAPVVVYIHQDPINNFFPYVQNMVVDSQGGLHVLFGTAPGHTVPIFPNRSFYLHRQPDGVWQTPMLLIDELIYPLQYLDSLMAIGPDDTLHFIWAEENSTTYPQVNAIYYQARFADGDWSNKQAMPIADNNRRPRLEDMIVADDGTVHVMWSRLSPSHQWANYHQRRSPNGQWSGPTMILQRDTHTGYVPGKLAVDSRGNVHAALFHSLGVFETMGYALWRPGTAWQVVEIEDQAPLYDLDITVDQYDIVHILNSNYYRSLPATANNTAVLSQQVTIPADMPAPTLAFMAQRPGDVPGDGSGLELLVSDGVTTTAVPLSNGGAAWTHYWADLSPWAGQTVTVDFRLTQVSGDLRVQAAIDDVTLGSAYPDTWVRASGPGSALPGETVVLALEYGNNGRVPATATELALTWPDALTFVSASVTPTVGVDTLTWDVGDLAAEVAPVTIVVTATVDAATPFWETIEMPVSLTAATTEVEQQNNEAVLSILIAHRLLLPVMARP